MQKNTGWDMGLQQSKFMRGAGAANSNSRVVHTSASSRTKTVPRLKAEGHLIPWRMTVFVFEVRSLLPSTALAQHHSVILDSGLAPYDPTNNSYNYTHQTSPGPDQD